jgi:uncharacterized protein
MKKMFVGSCLVVCLLVAGLAGCAEQKPTPTPTSVNVEQRAVQVVERMENGTLSAVFSSWFTSTIQSATSATQLEGVWAQLEAQQGTFQNITGVRNASVQNYTNVFVTCLFDQQNALDCQVTFDQAGLIAGLHFVPSDLSGEYRPPSYANTSAFTESNVTVGAGSEWPLPGTLGMPKGAGPFPAVVLVQGSGPNDRDETILANKPFKDLAWGLASQGIAVLRYEKRTKQFGALIAKNLENLTVWDETVQDAQRAVALLRSTPGINQSKIYVLGHSLGGMVAPRIAENGTGIAGLIMLAAPARHLEDLVLNQTIYLANLDGNVTSAEAEAIQNTTLFVEKVHSMNLSPGVVFIGAEKAYWDDLEGYNQVKTAQNLSLPMLFLQGKRDYQVNYTYDFLRWQAALGSKQGVTFHSYENLTHLFMQGSVPSSPQDYAVPGNIPALVIDDIASWVKNG